MTEGGDGHKGVPAVNRRAVDQYDRQGNFIRRWESMREIEKELNYNYTAISECARKRRQIAYNYY